MKKIKQLANNAFVRPDRTEVMEGLQKAEKRIDQIKLACESTAKKINACLQGQGKDGTPIEKRIKKVPEYLLGSTMIQNGEQLGDESVLGEVLDQSGLIEMKLGQQVVEFECKIEDCVLKPLQQLLDNDLPSIYKIKHQLKKYTENMDTAKAKLTQANRHSQGVKMDTIKEELEDAQQKVEQCRDHLAAEMYAIIARESELSRLFVDFLMYQKEYHNSCSMIIDELISGVQSCIKSSVHKPVFGVNLEEHLTTTQRTIAYPIELCVCGLLETAIEEEGLFRMAGSSSKVKKLKSAIDAGVIELRELVEKGNDPHVLASVLKLYLRELPEPLLTFALYNDWISAIRLTDSDEKLKALWTVIQNMPVHYRDNLRYLVKFLKELTNHQDVNKMSPANIAIVIAPNLLWCNTNNNTEDYSSAEASQAGMNNMTMTHLYSSLLDLLISYSSYFFPEDIDFYVTCEKPAERKAIDQNDGRNSSTSGLPVNGMGIDESSSSEDQTHNQHSQVKRSHSNSSVDEHSPPQGGSPKPVLRRKNKPAPVPPIQHTATKVLPPPSSSSSKVPFGGGGAARPAKDSQLKPGGHGSTKEKREGLWIPPSPRETQRKGLAPSKDDGQSSSMGPPKPPPPVLPPISHTGEPISPRLKLPSDPPPKPASPLRHKSSFKSNSVEAASSPLGSPSRPTNNTTDNIGEGSTPSGSPSSAFASLPRHFHTENSYKNQRPPRPPSMWGVPPPAPPQVPSALLPVSTTTTSTTATTTDNIQLQHGVVDKETRALDSKEETPTAPTLPIGLGLQLGFEKLELEIRKDSLTSEGRTIANAKQSESGESNGAKAEKVQINESPEEGHLPLHPRPIPAPRSSLLSQSQSFNSAGDSKGVGTVGGGDGKDIPVFRERPSLMAKPRELSKRNQVQSAPAPLAGLLETSHQPAQAEPQAQRASHHECKSRGSTESVDDILEADEELTKHNGELNYGLTEDPPNSPSGKLSHRLRPQPPVPPKLKGALGESTDL